MNFPYSFWIIYVRHTIHNNQNIGATRQTAAVSVRRKSHKSTKLRFLYFFRTVYDFIPILLRASTFKLNNNCSECHWRLYAFVFNKKKSLSEKYKSINERFNGRILYYIA